MYNQTFFMPNYLNTMPIMPNRMINPMVGGMMNRPIGSTMGGIMNGANTTASASLGRGLFSRLGGGLQAIKKINWGGLINNTSKTLNVVNQAIPLVRQVGPMVNNVKSMLKVASVFKDETDIKPNIKNNTTGAKTNNITNNPATSNIQEKKEDLSKYEVQDNSPTFFISS